MTFIMQETTVDNETKISVIGFYFGEPDETATQEYAGSLTAIVEA